MIKVDDTTETTAYKLLDMSTENVTNQKCRQKWLAIQELDIKCAYFTAWSCCQPIFSNSADSTLFSQNGDTL